MPSQRCEKTAKLRLKATLGQLIPGSGEISLDDWRRYADFKPNNRFIEF